ncbi:MAG: DUF2905 domain-containing protein [Methylocystis sp.]
MPKLLIIAGGGLIFIGVIWLMAERFGFSRLPGDIVIEKENFRFYFPITTCIVISIILSLIFSFLRR